MFHLLNLGQQRGALLLRFPDCFIGGGQADFLLLFGLGQLTTRPLEFQQNRMAPFGKLGRELVLLLDLGFQFDPVQFQCPRPLGGLVVPLFQLLEFG